MAAPVSQAATVLYFNSEQGDYIGQGQERTYHSGDFTINAYRNYYNGVGFSISGTSWRDYWNLNFSAIGRVELEAGLYDNATRFPFSDYYGAHGLSLTGSGRGCNQLTGSYEVLEVEYGTSNTINKFAADFIQYCDGNPAALRGSIRYNSEIPISALNPLKAVISLQQPLNAQSCVEATSASGTAVTVSAADSRDSQGGTNLSYLWDTSTGVTAQSGSLSFNVPLNQTVTAKLKVTDLETGESVTDTLNICSSDTTAPGIVINEPLEGEVIVGEGTHIDVSVSDAVDSAISTYDISMGTFSTHKLDANGESRVRLMEVEKKDLMPVTIKVTTTDESGNTAVKEIMVYKAHDLSVIH